MARKKITVVEASGNVRTIMVAEAEGNVEKWLDKLGVDSFVDSDSAEIIDFESLQDGGTYTLGPPRQQQHGALSLDKTEMEMLIEFVKNEKDERTQNKEMSLASREWAELILSANRVNHDRNTTLVKDEGTFKDPPSYEWTVQTRDGEMWNKSEYGGTQGALEWLKKNFLRSESPYGLKVVTGMKLPKVKGNGKSATGKTDLLIGIASDIRHGDTFDFARGIVELKTDKYPLKVGQNLLELLALSTASSFKKGVVLLATDCNTKWEVYYFSDATTIRSTVYKHGGRAWEDFLELLRCTPERNYVDKTIPWISSLPQITEQDLEGFDMSDREKKKAKAEEQETMLEHFADKLSDIYGERPTVPWWGRAEAKIPDYYA